MKQRAIGLCYLNDNNALSASTECYNYAFEQAGYQSEMLDLRVAGNADVLKQRLDEGNVGFCYAFQGIGSQLALGNVNLWTAMRTPFIGLHSDHPCHMPPNHVSNSPFVANLYYAECFLDVKQRYLPTRQLSGYIPPSFTGGLPPACGTAFEKRPIKLMFLKTGYKLDDLEAFIAALPSDWGKHVREQLDRAWRDPNISMCDLAAEVFQRMGQDWRTAGDKFWTITQLIDWYVRRQRALVMVEWLKHQEGAVIIGGGWDFIDKSNARAEFRPAIDANEATALYGQTQFIVNTNPHGRDILHERILYGLASDCCVISDTNAWWAQHCGHVPALKLFDFARSLDEQLRPAISDMSAAAEASLSGRAAAEAHFSTPNPQLIIEMVDKVRASAA